MRLLLISNSTMHGRGYFDHVAEELCDFLGEIRSILFVPYALNDRDGYAAKVAGRFKELGLEVTSIHAASDPAEAVRNAEALFIGGGNTFRLLNTLYEHDLLRPIRERVSGGMPYVGSSAGTNVATLSIKTTNDMPIVQPPSFEALGLVPFNINPHFLDTDPSSTHMGETREQRIREFHEMNEVPVLGLREGAWLRREGEDLTLKGTTGARLFLRGLEPAELESGASLSDLL
jgi:dipeptidase E